jgi:hypothetical protein
MEPHSTCSEVVVEGGGGRTEIENDPLKIRPVFPPAPKTKRELAPCGTTAAYQRHWKKGEKACEACLQAANVEAKRRNPPKTRYCQFCRADITGQPGGVRTCHDCASDSRRLKTKSRWLIKRRRDQILDRDRGLCQICGRSVDPTDLTPRVGINGRTVMVAGPLYPSIDHIVPVSLGGTSEFDNLRLAHLICNTRRGSRVA